MSTPRDSIALLSEVLSDTPQSVANKLLTDIKCNISKIDPPTKLYCISAILLSGTSNIRLEINKQPQLSMPNIVVVSKEWDITINIVAIKRDILLFELAPPPVERPGIIDELSPRISEMVDDMLYSSVRESEDLLRQLQITTSEMELSSSHISNIDKGKERKKITLDTSKITSMTPRLISVTPRVTSTSTTTSPRTMTANSYQVTKEQIASFWIDDKSHLRDKKVDLESNAVRAYLIEGLRSTYGISMLDSIARVKTVLTCEERGKLGEYIGTLRLDSNVIRDLKPSRQMEEVKKRLLKQGSISILDMRDLNTYQIKPIGLASLVANVPKAWCITCRVVKLCKNEIGDDILVSIGANSMTQHSIKYMDDVLGFTDRFMSRDLLYVNFISYESEQILLEVISELRLYIERHGLRRIKKETEVFVNVPLI